MNSESENWCQVELPRILDAFSVERIIVGHIPLADKRVLSTCEGKAILTDVTMSRWMERGGQPVAILMEISEMGNLSSMKAYYYDPATDVEETQIIIGQEDRSVTTTVVPLEPLGPLITRIVPPTEPMSVYEPEDEEIGQSLKLAKMTEIESPKRSAACRPNCIPTTTSPKSSSNSI